MNSHDEKFENALSKINERFVKEAGQYFNADTDESNLITSIITGMCSNWMVHYFARIKTCESPIEKLFALHFWDMLFRNSILFSCTLVNQHKYKINGNEIRVDFILIAIIGNKDFHLVIECDGHDFHEKTKEQAANDKKRDRLLKSIGLDVIRFTGSEIYKDPQNCVREAIDIVTKKAELEERANG